MRWGAFAIAMVLAPSLALAQGDDLWERGVALRAEGRDAEALGAFEELHRQTGSSRALAQVALAEGALGRWNDAAGHMDTALAQPDDWVTRNRATLEEARAEMARHGGTGAPASGGDSGLPVAGGVLLGVAGASAVVMAIAWAMREMHAARWNDECWPVGSTREDFCPEEDDSVYRAEYSAIGFGVGAIVFAAIGVTLLAIGGGGGGGNAELSCAPGLDAGIVCTGRF